MTGYFLNYSACCICYIKPCLIAFCLCLFRWHRGSGGGVPPSSGKQHRAGAPVPPEEGRPARARREREEGQDAAHTQRQDQRQGQGQGQCMQDENGMW